MRPNGAPLVGSGHLRPVRSLFDAPDSLPDDPDAEVRALVALTLVPGVGSARARALVARFGSARAVLAAPAAHLAAVDGVGRQTAAAVRGFDGWDGVERQFGLAARVGARPLAFTDPDYPALLRHIYDPPALLWVRGDLADAPAVAVVGTRAATDYGRRVAEAFAGGLAEAGVTVVSGLAYGIDAAAHAAALDAGGQTVAVLGSGVDRIYPARHAGLARRILGAGAVVSEMPMGAAPDAGNFPRRNRIVSGMSLGTLVAEARPRGGALLTAALALEQNREVFAAPAPVFSEMTGTNRLIQAGAAALVMSAGDILDALAPHLPARPDARAPAAPAPLPDDLTAVERQLLGALTPEPQPLDAVCDAARVDASTALVYLLQLEFRGLVRQLAGKQFFRT